MIRCSIEPRKRKYVKGYGFLPFATNLFDKYGEKLLDTAIKIVVHKTAEATGELRGNKITEKIMKSKHVP